MKTGQYRSETPQKGGEGGEEHKQKVINLLSVSLDWPKKCEIGEAHVGTTANWFTESR